MSDILYHAESSSLWLSHHGLSDIEADQGAVQVEPAEIPTGWEIKNVGLTQSSVLPSLDFETYSAAGFRQDAEGKIKGIGTNNRGGLMVVGTPVYAEHPSAEVLSLAYNLKNGEGEKLWVPGMPAPHDLLDHVTSGGFLEAWNATFEFYIWNMVCRKLYGWPALPIEQMVCVMARSRRFNLPGGLDNAAKVLGVPEKDKAGKSLLQKLTRPHTPTKKRPSVRWTPATAWEDFQKLYAYNCQDVVSEDHCAARIPDFTDTERAVWVMDQRINARGVQVDVESLDNCLALMEDMFRKYTMELVNITNGVISSVSEVAKIIEWINFVEPDAFLTDLGADTVEAELQKGHGAAVHRVLNT